jgi:hypothetical protein
MAMVRTGHEGNIWRAPPARWPEEAQNTGIGPGWRVLTEGTA